jgi:hypothetical protein
MEIFREDDTMLSKSIRLTKGDVIGLQELINHDPRIEKGQSEALFYAFKDAAANIPKWSVVATTKFEGDNNVELDPNDYSNIRTFNIEQEDFDVVVKSFRDQLDISKPRISYMTRLCILAARMRLNVNNTTAPVEVIKLKVDGISLIRKVAELLESDTEEAWGKITDIKKIVEGGLE